MGGIDFAVGTRAEDFVHNEGTSCRIAGGVFDREPFGGQAAMARYESHLRRALGKYDKSHVYVACIDSDYRPIRYQVLAPGEALVFGRHAHTTLMHTATDVSLRHVSIAVATCSTAQAPLVRLWNLATEHPMTNEDGSTADAITADGPVFVTVGSIYLAVIPMGSLPDTLPPDTKSLWETLPQRRLVSSVASGTGVHPLKAPDNHPAPARNHTSVTLLSGAREPVSCAIGSEVAVLNLQSKYAQHRFLVSPEALECGILIGRYGRCLYANQKSRYVSRVHLLIARVGDDIVAIDTASSGGSARESGEQFSCTVLANDEQIILAHSLYLNWHYRQPSRA